MPIKIVKEEPDPSIVKQVVCRNCGVTLEYLPCDVQSKQVQDIDGTPDEVCWISCPKCMQPVYVKRF